MMAGVFWTRLSSMKCTVRLPRKIPRHPYDYLASLAPTQAVEPLRAWNLDVANEKNPQPSKMQVAGLFYP
jgi:hypothetical protein